MAEIKTENQTPVQIPIISAKQLGEKMQVGEKMTLECNGWIETVIDGNKTKAHKNFKSYQIILLGDTLRVSFSSTIKDLPTDPNEKYTSSAGWKLLKHQQAAFRKQFPDKGDINHYRITVELEKVNLNGKEFLSAKVLPKIGKRVYTPNTGGFVLFEGDEATINNPFNMD